MNHQFRENYTPTPDTGLSGPYTKSEWQTFDIVLIFLAGMCAGAGLTLWLTL